MTPAPLIVTVALLAVYLPHAVVLSVIDLREHRLPNPIVASMTVGVLVVAAGIALFAPWSRGGVLAALAVAGTVAVLGIGTALLAPGVIGMGDAKAAPAMVLVAALLGWDVLLGGLLGVALLGGAAGVLLLVVSRSPAARFAYGPVLLSGPVLGLMLAPAVRAALGVG